MMIAGGMAYGQFNDGPIQLRGRLRQFNITFPETDVAFFGIVGQPDDLSYNIWGREPVTNGVSWVQGLIPGLTCSGNGLLEDYTPPLNNWNAVFYDFTTPTPAVGGLFEVRLDALGRRKPRPTPRHRLRKLPLQLRCRLLLRWLPLRPLPGVRSTMTTCASGNTVPYQSLNYRLESRPVGGTTTVPSTVPAPMTSITRPSKPSGAIPRHELRERHRPGRDLPRLHDHHPLQQQRVLQQHASVREWQ
ncbi:MAG: hypothetical protein U0176_10095 [Bacteroidia bacterium]